MKKWRRASFTAEAAMIMGVVLLVIMTALEGSRFVYERAVTTAREYEESLLKRTEDPSPVTFARRAQFIRDGLSGE